MITNISAQGSVELTRVSKIFPSGAIGIEDINLGIRPGEFVTFLGPSGSGKTTTLNTIAGFITPSAGAVVIDGVDVTSLAPNKRNLGMVFQNYALFPHMTVEQNVAFGLHRRGLSRTEMANRVTEALDMVRLSGYETRRPKELSGGQQQRVALARALVYRPPILLMDEPLGALDKQLRDQMQVEIARLHRDLGTTFLFVTHDQSEALALSDRIVLFRSGGVVQVGTPEEMYTRPNSRFAAEFLGESTSFPGVLTGPDAVTWSGRPLRGLHLGDAGVGDPITLVVRPEHLSITTCADRVGPGRNQVTGCVSELTYLGSHRRIGVRLDDDTRVVLEDPVNSDSSLALGDDVIVHWAPEQGVLVSGSGS